MKTEQLDSARVVDLLYQALETEKGGVQVYTTALRCAVNAELKKEWNEYLEQTKQHVQIVSNILTEMNLPLDTETHGRKIVRQIGEALVKAMETALKGPDLTVAQIVAAECVTLAETKDHLNWELLGEAAKKAKAATAKVIKEAHEQVEEQEDEHLYHTKGWTRELWIKSLGMKAVLPPPEEVKDVKTAIGAARAQNARTDMM